MAYSNGSADIVEGIENMQILYGADTADADNGAQLLCIQPDTVGLDMAQCRQHPHQSNWPATLDDNLAAQPLAYTYNGVTGTPSDRKIRRVFNTNHCRAQPAAIRTEAFHEKQPHNSSYKPY